MKDVTKADLLEEIVIKGNPADYEVEDIVFADGLFIKKMRISKGCLVMAHTHSYSHVSFLESGKVVLTMDDEEKLINAPAMIEIKAGVKHAILAGEDSVWYCIHAQSEVERCLSQQQQ